MIEIIITNAQSVVLNMNKAWDWSFADYPPKNGFKVFSCFSCGGGSTMGYKKAGFDVIGNLEIDNRMMDIYKKNHNPRYPFLMDIRDFNKLDNIPQELLELDILDGSPPCSSFSTAGNREKDWGKEKVFAEGQAQQTLTVQKLKPKIVIAENVEGLLLGKAKGYVKQIINRFYELGYDVQIFLLNAAFMDVPQKRKRVFFIANNQGYPKLKLEFNQPVIKFGEVRTEQGKPHVGKYYELLQNMKNTDTNISDISKRVRAINSGFTSAIYHDSRVANTLINSGSAYRAYDKLKVSDTDCLRISTFPRDFDFMGRDAKYVCGMSVPPNMMYHIANQINKQWLTKGD